MDKISRKSLETKVAKGAKVKTKKPVPKKSPVETSEQKQIKLLQKSLESTLKKMDAMVDAVSNITVESPDVKIDVKPDTKPLIKIIKVKGAKRGEDDRIDLNTVEFHVQYGKVKK